MSKNQALTHVEQKEITFYDDVLTAIRSIDGRVYVSLPSICDALGIQTSAQTKRVKRHEVLADGYHVASMTYTSKMDEQPIQRRQVGVLRVDLVPLWLTGLSVKSVKLEMQPKIKRYQREAAAVLWEAFQDGRLTTDLVFEDLLQNDSPAAQAYKMLQAMMQLARNQVLLEAKFQEHDTTLLDYGQRIEELEASMSNEDRYITREQASRISQAVRGIGLLLTKQSGSSEYGRVYGELYRKFEISAYRELPASKYDEAMKWLNEWRQNLVEDVAF